MKLLVAPFGQFFLLQQATYGTVFSFQFDERQEKREQAQREHERQMMEMMCFYQYGGQFAQQPPPHYAQRAPHYPQQGAPMPYPQQGAHMQPVQSFNAPRHPSPMAGFVPPFKDGWQSQPWATPQGPPRSQFQPQRSRLGARIRLPNVPSSTVTSSAMQQARASPGNTGLPPQIKDIVGDRPTLGISPLSQSQIRNILGDQQGDEGEGSPAFSEIENIQGAETTSAPVPGSPGHSQILQIPAADSMPQGSGSPAFKEIPVEEVESGDDFDLMAVSFSPGEFDASTMGFNEHQEY